MSTPQAILAESEARHVRFVDLEFTDIVGMIKAVTVPIEQLPQCLEEGRWFDGSSIEGFARVTESDMFLRPDPTTFAIVPWEPARARLICDVMLPDGELFEGDPRACLQRSMARAAAQGLRYEVASEIEFFLLKPVAGDPAQVIPFDQGSYFDLVNDPAARFWRDVMEALDGLRVPVEASHHEVAGGQYEVDLQMQDALGAADAIISCKQALKAVALNHGLVATFLPKPISTINGSGMHLHQRLVRQGSGVNVFASQDDPEYNLSETGLQFIAGQLAHAHGTSAIVGPLVNSYKRLVPHFEAPVALSWGHHNQSTLIRVPRVNRLRAKDVRVELRNPDPSCNPYLALAVLLAAGLDGMERQMECPPPELAPPHLTSSARAGSGKRLLPQSLAQALDGLEADPLMRATLGPQIADQFLDAKWQEWESYRREVTTWELRRYLPLF